MRRAVIVLIAVLFVASFVICGKAFAQKDTSDTQVPAEQPIAAEPTAAVEPPMAVEPPEAPAVNPAPEKTVPYSAEYNNPSTGAERANADEDSE